MGKQSLALMPVLVLSGGKHSVQPLAELSSPSLILTLHSQSCPGRQLHQSMHLECLLVDLSRNE